MRLVFVENSRNSIVVFIQSFLFIFASINQAACAKVTYLIEKPENIYGYLNKSIQLKCCTEESILSWKYSASTDKAFQRFSSGTDLEKRYKDEGFSVDELNSCFNLTIERLKFKHAGVYECSSSRTDIKAQLVILASDPVCSCDGCNETSSVSNITMQCSITYSGNLDPVIEWHENGDLQPSSSHTEKQDSNKVLLSVVTIQRNNSAFTTYESITFFQPIKEHPSYANNVLNYRFKWQVTAGVKSSKLPKDGNNSTSSHSPGTVIWIMVGLLVAGILLLGLVLALLIYFNRGRRSNTARQMFESLKARFSNNQHSHPDDGETRSEETEFIRI